MDISVVIPLYNEEEPLPELFAWIQRVMNQNDFSYEVIFVNDGSTDRSWQVIEELAAQNDTVKRTVGNTTSASNEVTKRVILFFL